MRKQRLRERSDIPIDKIAPIFSKRGYSIGIINQNDRESMIAINDQCMIYMYFPEHKDEDQDQTLYDKERNRTVRNLNTLITKNIYNYIKNSSPEESRIHRHDLYVTKIEQFEYIKEPELLQDIAYFDLNHTYLQVARRLGYINKRSYEKILAIYPEYKIEVCTAIVSMAKSVQCVYYRKKSIKKVQRIVECDYSGIRQIRDNIVYASHLILSELCENNNISFFARNVDAVVIPRSKANKLAKALDKLKIKYKQFEGKYAGHGMLLQDDCEYFDMGDMLINQQTLNNKA